MTTQNEAEKYIPQSPTSRSRKEGRKMSEPQTNNNLERQSITMDNDRLKSNCKVVHCHSLPAASTMFMSIFGP
jgi:hypothetical protein